MKGKIIDMSSNDAAILLEDGTSVNVSISHLPYGSRVGSEVNLNPSTIYGIEESTVSQNKISNDKLVDFF